MKNTFNDNDTKKNIDNIKKIIINPGTNKLKTKNRDKLNKIKKLADDPEKIKKYLEEKMNTQHLKSWIFPGQKEQKQPKINEIINHIKKDKTIHSHKKKKIITKPKVKPLHGGSRQYTTAELTHLIKLLIELRKNETQLNHILMKLNRNQCIQILKYKKLLHKIHNNAPMPLLRFIVCQHILLPKITYKVSTN